MHQETSTVSTATWLSLPSSPPPTTVLSDPIHHPMYPRDTPSPSCCDPNQVVIQLSTTLFIPDYDLYYASTPIHLFQPTFFPLDDASLITPAFLSDLTDANISLLIAGMLTMLFVRNLYIAIDYIRRCKVKNKILFHLLIISQLLAPIGFVPSILSYFNREISCTVVIVLSGLAATTSLAILISGILGIKAYKCLNNSRFVAIMLVIFQLGSSAAVAMDVAATRGSRRLSGSCIRTTEFRFARVYVTIQFAESLFICICFLYACFKSRGSAAVRGRMSITLSMDNLSNEANDSSEGNPARRGWWDHVAPSPSEKFQSYHLQRNQKKAVVASFFNRVVEALPLGSQPSSLDRKGRRRRSHGSKGSIVALPQPSTVRISSGPPEEIRDPPTLPSSPVPRPHIGGRSSPVPSTFSRFSKLIPRVESFRAVMRDELLYTTAMTGTCVVAAILVIVGLDISNGLTVTGWIVLNWGIISILTIHSFGRVVHRHERDALLQHLATCDAQTRAGFAGPYTRRRQSHPSSLRFQSRSPYRPTSEDNLSNPFSDGWGSDVVQNGATAAVPDGQPPSPVVSFKTLMHPTLPWALPSPHSPPDESDLPASGQGTPLVPHDGTDGTVIQRFPDSCVYEDDSFSEFSVRTKSTRRDRHTRTSLK